MRGFVAAITCYAISGGLIGCVVSVMGVYECIVKRMLPRELPVLTLVSHGFIVTLVGMVLGPLMILVNGTSERVRYDTTTMSVRFWNRFYGYATSW